MSGHSVLVFRASSSLRCASFRSKVTFIRSATLCFFR